MSVEPDHSFSAHHAVKPSPVTGNAFGVLAMVTWAIGFPMAEILLETWNPLSLIAARFGLAMAMLVPIWLILEGPRVVSQARWDRGAWIGGFSFGIGAFCLLLAQWFTDPITVAVIATAMPVAATILEVTIGLRKLRARFVFGLSLTVLGGVVATGAAPSAGSGGADLIIGAALAVTSCFLFAIGSHRTVHDFPDLTPLGRSTITLGGGVVFSAIAVTAASVLGYDMRPSVQMDAESFGYLAVYAVAGMALSQVMWIACVGRLGVAVASLHINTAPFYLMLMLLAFGGGWNWMQALGAAIIGLGVFVAQKN